MENCRFTPLLYCAQDYETIEHLFYECDSVKDFWRMFSSWYECLTDTEINLSMENIFFCNYPDNNFLNTLLIMAKQFIFARRLAEKELNIYTFKEHLMIYVKIE